MPGVTRKNIFLLKPGKNWLEAKHLWEDLIDKDNLGNVLHCDVCLVDVSSYPTMVTHLNGTFM